ncbi:MAG: Gfo/Idh/MocA family oxidoreductase [Planctomycetota bacterium]|nr:Gfo/Idh/MocA family oxidoreductase [Planctomycetota bacterium]
MTVKVGLVGLGMMGGAHFAAYRDEVDAAEVVAVCDSRAERLAPGGEAVEGNIDTGAGETMDLSGIRTYTELDRLLDDPDIDMVDLCLPTHLHAPMTIKALDAGKNVFCEKPMALTAGDANKMITASDKAGKMLMIGHCLRFWPEYVMIKEMIDSSRYGKVLSAVFRRVSSNPTWSADGWLLRAGQSGLAAIDLHIHDVDTLQWFFGPPKAVIAGGVKHEDGGIGHIVAHYEYDDGPMVVAEGGWDFPPEFPFSMSAVVMFEKATVEYDSRQSPAMTVYPAGGCKVTPEVPTANAYAEELKYFVGCIAGGGRPDRVSPAESAKAVAIVEAEIKSAKSGGKITKIA